MDHPVLAARLEQHEPALGALAVQHDLDLAVGPLLGVVRAVVPDRHLAGAVLTVADVALERSVLQRMVLDVDGQVVALRIVRDALGHCPRDEHAVAFQAEVPVQRGRVVFLDYERVALLAPRAAPPRHRLTRALGVSLAAILVQRGHPPILLCLRLHGEAGALREGSAIVVVVLRRLAMLLHRVGRLGLQGKGVLRLLVIVAGRLSVDVVRICHSDLPHAAADNPATIATAPLAAGCRWIASFLRNPSYSLRPWRDGWLRWL